jgi:hypothetical protein
MRCGRAVVLLGLLLLLDARVRAAGLGLGDRDTSEVEQLERDAVQDESGAVREVKQAQRDSSVMRQLEREAGRTIRARPGTPQRQLRWRRRWARRGRKPSSSGSSARWMPMAARRQLRTCSVSR